MDDGYSHKKSGLYSGFREQDCPGNIPECEGDKSLVEPVFLFKFACIYPDKHENMFLDDN